MDLILQPLASIPWVLIVAIGTLILGLAIAYGVMRNSRRTPREKAISEAGAHDLYKKD